MVCFSEAISMQCCAFRQRGNLGTAYPSAAAGLTSRIPTHDQIRASRRNQWTPLSTKTVASMQLPLGDYSLLSP